MEALENKYTPHLDVLFPEDASSAKILELGPAL